ncbi:MAG: tryptophan-rich sensory protein [Firmicutes bacterium]|nr:tryptophan-rich sensory protein [Bacillota bacterium]
MKTLKTLIILFGPLLCGIIVGLLTNNHQYELIIKPPYSPPAIIFPIVWSILYLLMGISLYIIIKNNNNATSIRVFITQLVTNLIWPFIFFNFKLYYLAAFWLLLLIYFVINMIVNFYSIKKIASYLQISYFLWLLFALYLNLGVALLN